MGFSYALFTEKEKTMRRITIGGKEYTLTFNIIASLYNECTEMIMNEFLSYGKTVGAAEANDIDGMLDKLVKSMANTTEETVTLFYASLLEYHGTRRGDGSVKAKDDALDLLYTYLDENTEKTLFDVYNEMMEIIVEDNFFVKTGLNQRLEQIFKTEDEKKPRKKKNAKVGETS